MAIELKKRLGLEDITVSEPLTHEATFVADEPFLADLRA